MNALQAQLSALAGGKLTVVNDPLRDLVVLSESGEHEILMEIKTSSDRQSIYSAIGQLFFNRVDDATALCIVAPADLTLGPGPTARDRLAQELSPIAQLLDHSRWDTP